MLSLSIHKATLPMPLISKATERLSALNTLPTDASVRLYPFSILEILAFLRQAFHPTVHE